MVVKLSRFIALLKRSICGKLTPRCLAVLLYDKHTCLFLHSYCELLRKYKIIDWRKYMLFPLEFTKAQITFQINCIKINRQVNFNDLLKITLFCRTIFNLWFNSNLFLNITCTFLAKIYCLQRLIPCNAEDLFKEPLSLSVMFKPLNKDCDLLQFSLLLSTEHKTFKWCLRERINLNLNSTSLNFPFDSIINTSMFHDLGLHSTVTEDNQSLNWLH